MQVFRSVVSHEVPGSCKSLYEYGTGITKEKNRAVTGRRRGVSDRCDEETSAGSFRTLGFRHRWAESTEAAGGETSASATWWRSPGPETHTSSPVWQTSGHLSIKPNRREKTLSGLSLKEKSRKATSLCFFRTATYFSYKNSMFFASVTRESVLEIVSDPKQTFPHDAGKIIRYCSIVIAARNPSAPLATPASC